MNRKSIRNISIISLVIILLLNTWSMAKEIEDIKVRFNGINLSINGEDIQTDNLLYNGVRYIPLREAAELAGYSVSFDEETNIAIISEDGESDNATIMPGTDIEGEKEIDVVFNGTYLMIDGKEIDGDNIVYDGITYIPLKTATEILGTKIKAKKRDSILLDDEEIEIDKKEDKEQIEINIPAGAMTDLYKKSGITKAVDKMKEKGYKASLEIKPDESMLWTIPKEIQEMESSNAIKEFHRHIANYRKHAKGIEDIDYTDDFNEINIKIDSELLDAKMDKTIMRIGTMASVCQIVSPSDLNVQIILEDMDNGEIIKTIYMAEELSK